MKSIPLKKSFRVVNLLKSNCKLMLKDQNNNNNKMMYKVRNQAEYNHQRKAEIRIDQKIYP